MKVVILAGGRGTRMGEETDILPKPLIKIGGIPMIRHIMDYYAKWSIKDFVILAGYKIEKLVEYFEKNDVEGWNIKILDTGEDTQTGQRLLEAEPLINGEAFMLTYGDGIGNVNVSNLQSRRTIGMVTAVHPPGRFGTLTFQEGTRYITRFDEKQRLETVWINGGFMGFSNDIFKWIEKDEMLEFDVLPRLAAHGELEANFHYGQWMCMDTPRDREALEKEWSYKRCFWRTK